MDPEAQKLAEEIETSRKEIEKLQERVRQLVARRGKRAELVKSTHALTGPDLPAEAVTVTPGGARAATPEEIGEELSLEQGMAVLRNIRMSQVRLIAFKHGAVIFLFEDEKTLSVRMDDRGPKPLLDLLTTNEQKSAGATSSAPPRDPLVRP